MFADMHTHSEFSHDSRCKIEDMRQAQSNKGTEIFAVTDHFDTDSFNDYDVFTPILKAREQAIALNQTQGSRVLAGIEISEGFWHPEVCKKALTMTDYDVVIGSVHLVQYKDLTKAFSKIDFSKLSRQTVAEYIDAYFSDMITMLNTTDIDILAHLSCPLRYINGKYHLDFKLDPYMDKIDRILKEIISLDIALEVNTSSIDVMNVSMPDAAIIQKYHDFGGRLITLGSDAHVHQNASANFDIAASLLREIGFDNTYFYQNRKPFPVKL